MGKRKKLDNQEQLKVLEWLKDAQTLIRDIRIRIGSALGAKSASGRIAAQIEKRLFLLRQEVQKVFFQTDDSERYVDDLIPAGKLETPSYEQHLELGVRVKAERELLMSLQLTICNGMGTSSKPCTKISQLLDLMDLGLKNELDKVIFRNHPSKDTHDLIGVHYGDPRKDTVRLLHKPPK